MNIYLLLISIVFITVSCSSAQKDDPKYMSDSEKKAKIHYTHGTEKLVEKNYTMALNHLRKAVKADPKDAKIHNNLGMAYYFKGKLDMAIQHLQTAIELDKESFDALNNLASIYFKQGRYDQAQSQYEKVLSHLDYPHLYRTHYNMALIYLRKGSERKARMHLNQSITESNDYCPSYFLMGKLDYNIKNFNSAYENFHKAGLGTCFKEVAPIFWKGKTLLEQNRLFKAEQIFRTLMKKHPNTVYARRAATELRDVKRREILATKVRQQNFRYNKNEKPLQSKNEDESEVVESPSF